MAANVLSLLILFRFLASGVSVPPSPRPTERKKSAVKRQQDQKFFTVTSIISSTHQRSSSIRLIVFARRIRKKG